jgi:hypothetical protein
MRRTAHGSTTGAFAYAVTHVEAGLKRGVGDELGGAWLMDLPPELAVALEARGVAGFGETVWHSAGGRGLA